MCFQYVVDYNKSQHFSSSTKALRGTSLKRYDHIRNIFFNVLYLSYYAYEAEETNVLMFAKPGMRLYQVHCWFSHALSEDD